MKWMILLLAGLGGAVYLGYIKLPGPNDLPGIDSTGIHLKSYLPAPSPASSIRTLSSKVLVPLESPQTLPADAQKTLDTLGGQITAQGNQRDSARELQALNLLAQALAERNTVLTRLNHQATSARNPLDNVPGKWHVVGHPETQVDVPAMQNKWRNSFWAKAELNNWRARCEYYKTSIEALLAPAR